MRSDWNDAPAPGWYDREATPICIGGPADRERRAVFGRLGDDVMIATKEDYLGERYRWTETTINGQSMEFLAFHALTQTEAENRLMEWMMDRLEEESREPLDDDIDWDNLFGEDGSDAQTLSDEALGHLCRLVSDLAKMGHESAVDPADLLAELIEVVEETL